MMLSVWLWCVMWGSGAVSVLGEEGEEGRRRYGFYREMYEEGGASSWRGGGGRRVFGGERAAEEAWPAACVLLDRYWAPRCSGSVVTARWVLTAAHCVTPRLAYVKYNTVRPSAGSDGDHSPVYYLYRHPEYKVVQEDHGRGTDVTVLRHDVGLVRTLDVMKLRAEPAVPALRSIATYTTKDIEGQVVEILGFGRTEELSQGEQLVSARLRVELCDRSTWVPCVCGRAGCAGCAPAPAGVCSGDSGGPVVYRGTQVGVVSMGPVECASTPSGLGPRTEDTPTSVFTSISGYSALINATILDTDNALQMMRIPREANTASLAPTPTTPTLLVLVLVLVLVLGPTTHII